jgi:hypothetical protein
MQSDVTHSQISISTPPFPPPLPSTYLPSWNILSRCPLLFLCVYAPCSPTTLHTALILSETYVQTPRLRLSSRGSLCKQVKLLGEEGFQHAGRLQRLRNSVPWVGAFAFCYCSFVGVGGGGWSVRVGRKEGFIREGVGRFGKGDCYMRVV